MNADGKNLTEMRLQVALAALADIAKSCELGGYSVVDIGNRARSGFAEANGTPSSVVARCHELDKRA